MTLVEEIRERGRLAYLVHQRGRATWLVLRHLGNGNLCLHWISTRCSAEANPQVALRLSLGTRRPGKRARPRCAEVTVARLANGEFCPDVFPNAVKAILRGVSNHALVELCAGSNRPEPDWATEPEPLWSESDDECVVHWRQVGVAEAIDGSGYHVILSPSSDAGW